MSASARQSGSHDEVWLSRCEHVVGHEMPAGLLVTAPPFASDTVSVCWYVTTVPPPPPPPPQSMHGAAVADVANPPATAIAAQSSTRCRRSTGALLGPWTGAPRTDTHFGTRGWYPRAFSASSVSSWAAAPSEHGARWSAT